MTWKPDERLQRLVTGIIASHREQMVRSIRDQHSRVAEDYAHRGLGGSGALLAKKYEIETHEYDTFARTVIGQVSGLFYEIYDDIPVEATPWIRETLTAIFDAIARGIAAEDAERHRRAARPMRRRWGSVATVSGSTKPN